MDPEVIDTPADIPAEVEAPSLRDALDDAFDDADTPKDEAPSKEAKESAPEPKDEAPAPAKDKADVKAETVPLKEGKKPEEAQLPEAPPIPPKKAPASWSPAQREKWGKIDPDIQSQILKREAQISTGFNEISEVKKFRDGFLNTINPHQALFTAEGNDPVRTIGNLLQTASTLYHGAPMQKVQVVASIIKNFGIDLQTLDSVLAGQTPAEPQGGGQFNPQVIQQMVDAQVRQVLAPVMSIQQEREQKAEREIISELTAFAEDPANEFYEDVKMTMADILDLAANRNEKMSLQTAYSRAILMHNDIAELVQERKLRTAAAKSNQAAQSARRAGRSISGAPAPVSANASQGNSLRGALDAAFDQLQSNS